MADTRRWWAGACAALLPLSAVFAQALPPTTSDYLDAAIGVGDWMADVTQQGSVWSIGAVRPDGGFSVANSTIGPEAGAAGLGVAWLGLYDHTGDPKWLALAEKAAAHEVAQFETADHGPDYLSGAAGSGLFMLALHERSGDAQHLAWAKRYAQWLDDTALHPAPGERYWLHAPDFPRTYTGIPHGAAGIALLYLALAQVDGDALALEAAQEAYRWIKHHELPIGNFGAIGYKRLVDDSAAYTWWSGGSAGILQVQGLLYGLTGEPSYLDDLRRTADGLVASADAAEPRGLFWSTNGNASAYRPIVFSHGNASVAPALLIANEYAPDPDYVATAKSSIDWLEAIARDGIANQAPGVFWEHSKNSSFGDLQTTGAFIGTASIGWMLARMHALAGEARLKTLALQNADYLLGIGEHLPGGRRRWIAYTSPPDADWGPKEYALGWYDGNAGIALFLLAAHEIATGQRPRLDVLAP